MPTFQTELMKVQCEVKEISIAGLSVFVLNLPLGEIVIVEPTVRAQKHTPEQVFARGAIEAIGIKWLTFHSPDKARREADKCVNRDRTRAEVIRLAEEYTNAATAYETQDIYGKTVPCFDEQDEALRSMVQMMQFNNRKSAGTLDGVIGLECNADCTV